MKIHTLNILAIFFLSISALAQSVNPCSNQELLRLKSLPKASLTESERKAFNRLNAECEKFKAQTAKPIEHATTESTIQGELNDTNKVVLQEEPFATTRNFTILGAMCAAIAGIIIALNATADSPF